MMNILAYVSLEEKNKIMHFESLYSTYNTLLKIDDYDIDKDTIRELQRKLGKEKNEFWMELLDKYNIPLVIDRNIMINYQDGYIYSIE